MSIANWNAEHLDRYRDQVASGLHDLDCEQQERSSLCNCSKRRREAAGLTVAPTEDLYFPPPACPSCDAELTHDGDSWCCYACSLAWDPHGTGSSARFTDNYGDLTAPRTQFGQRLRAVVAIEDSPR